MNIRLSENRVDQIIADHDLQAKYTGNTAPVDECVRSIVEQVQEEVVRLQVGLPYLDVENQSSRTRALQTAMQRKREADPMLFVIALVECAEEARHGHTSTNDLLTRLRSALPEGLLQVGDYDPSMDRDLTEMDVKQSRNID